MATTPQQTSAFPVDWNAIDDGEGQFSHDVMHFPFPISPLFGSTFQAFAEGHRAGFHSLGIPERAFQTRVVNHYRYDRVLTDPPASEAQGAAQATLTEQTLHRELARMIDRWFGEHRPRLVELDQQLRQMRPRGRSGPEVLALLDQADAIQREAWQIHFTIAPLMTLAMQLLREMHADLFGESDGAMTLMAGNVSESVKAGFGLADLAKRARELELDAMIRSVPEEELHETLAGTVAGRAFLVDLDGYLEDYGLRQDLFDLATPTWRENPTFALASVRSYLETGYDPRAAHAEIGRAAEAAFEAAIARLADYPAVVSEQFEQMVQLGRQGSFLQEEHNFYIDQRLLSLSRLFYLEVGEHLCDLGFLDRPDDVFMLQLDEIRELVAAAATTQTVADTHTMVARRREEVAQAATMTPPPTIGDAAERPTLPDTPLSRSLAAFFGWGPPKPVADRQLAGMPGSRGIASGPAHIARTLEEARTVKPGEILVAVTTMPPWTPLFGIAAAVVTETGGPLSHCAVVAREYGIPAVVGARGATTAIRSGQRVTVDGDTGVVTIES